MEPVASAERTIPVCLRKVRRLTDFKLKDDFLFTIFTALSLFYYLYKFKPHFVVYAGHGSRDSWVGNDIIFRLVTEDNADWLEKRIAVSAPACSSASVLGKVVVNRGGLSFLGSTDIMYGAFPAPEHNYTEDFIKGYFIGIKSFLTNNITLREAYEIYKKYWIDLSNYYESKIKEWGNADFYSFASKRNADGYVLLGNGNITLDEILKYDYSAYVDMIKKIIKPLMSISIIGSIGLATTLLFKDKIYQTIDTIRDMIRV